MTILNKFHYYFYRPAFLPDPNDGSLYSLGGKNNEGLTVRDNFFSFLMKDFLILWNLRMIFLVVTALEMRNVSLKRNI